MTLIRALVDRPVSYDEILSRLDPAQAANVTGEEDNSFVPSEVPSSTSPDDVQSTTLPAGSGQLPAEVNDDLTAPTSEGLPHTKRSASCNAVPGQRSSDGVPVLLLLAWAGARRRKRRYAVTA